MIVLPVERQILPRTAFSMNLGCILPDPGLPDSSVFPFSDSEIRETFRRVGCMQKNLAGFFLPVRQNLTVPALNDGSCLVRDDSAAASDCL